MAFVINVGIEAMDRLRYLLVLHFIHPGGGLGVPWLVFNAISCAAALVAALGVVYIAPLAAGSGIQHIKAHCNGADTPGLLAAMGAGAGVAAAFVAPMAGAAYAVEEASSHYSGTMMSQALLAGGVTVCLLWLFTAATRVGSDGLTALMFSNPLALAFRGDTGTDVRFWWYVWEVPLMLLLGVLGALLAASWTFLTTRMIMLRKKGLLKTPAGKVATVVLCCLITNSVRLFAAYGSRCLPVPPEADLGLLEKQVVNWQFFPAQTGLYPQLWCPQQHYSAYGQLFMLPLEICMPGWSVLGAVALLTGATRLTLSNCLIVLESSGAVEMTVPVVLLAIPAKVLADVMFPCIYDWQIEEIGYEFLPPLDAVSSREHAAMHTTKVEVLLAEQYLDNATEQQQLAPLAVRSRVPAQNSHDSRCLGTSASGPATGRAGTDSSTTPAGDDSLLRAVEEGRAPSAAADASNPRLQDNVNSSIAKHSTEHLIPDHILKCVTRANEQTLPNKQKQQ
eukprot:gene2490-2793_t